MFRAVLSKQLSLIFDYFQYNTSNFKPLKGIGLCQEQNFIDIIYGVFPSVYQQQSQGKTLLLPRSGYSREISCSLHRPPTTKQLCNLKDHLQSITQVLLDSVWVEVVNTKKQRRYRERTFLILVLCLKLYSYDKKAK